MKKTLSLILALTLAVGLLGLGGSALAADLPTVVVGASAVPHAEVLEFVRDDLAAEGYNLDVKIFDDYVLPNTALQDGELDANYFQHTPYLNSFNASNGTDLVSVGAIHYEPFGIYSESVTDLKDVPAGATILVPADDSNMTRALLLLQQEGLIKLPESASVENGVTQLDIEDDGGFTIAPVQADTLSAQLKNSDEGTLAVINLNYALDAGYKTDDALALEDASGDAAQTYANIIAVKVGNEENPGVQALLKVLQTEKVAKYLSESFGCVAAFETAAEPKEIVGTVVVGASAVPHAEVLEFVKDDLAAEGYELDIKIFDDYVLPNTALQDGELDANYFQHTPYLNSFNASNGTDLVSVGAIHYEPFGIYSESVTDLKDVPAGATILVPADDSNMTRALLLLQQEGLIKLPESASVENGVTQLDIEDDGGFTIAPVQADTLSAQLKNSDEGTLAVINLNYALDAGYKTDDALALEDASGDAAQTYANIIAVKVGNEENPGVQALLKVLQTEKVAKYLSESFGCVAAFETAAEPKEIVGTVVVGASAVPHAEVLEFVKDDLAAEGYELDIKIFDDYVLPNTALQDGELDANYFQHTPYLNSFNASNGTDLVSVGAIHYEPFGIYSESVTDLKDVPAGATILVPADDSNMTRALLLLQQEGLIKLPESASVENGVTQLDIEDDGGYAITPVQADMLSAQLKNSDKGTLAVINLNYALDAGYKTDDALALEDASGDAAQTYANIIAVKVGNEENPGVQALLKVLQTEKVAEYLSESFGCVAAFETK